MNIKVIAALFFIVLSVGCAKRYQPMHLTPLIIDTGQTEPISFSANEKTWGPNHRNMKKATKNNLLMVQLTVKNQSSETIELNPIDFALNPPGDVLDVNEAFQRARARVWPYAFYLPLSLTLTSGAETTVLPVGLPIGIGNLSVAYVANRKLRKDLDRFHFRNIVLKSGETKDGLLYFNHPNTDDWAVVLNRENQQAAHAPVDVEGFH